MSTKPQITVTSPLLPPLEEFIAYLQQIWDSKWITNNGSFHQLLEKELAAYLGVEYRLMPYSSSSFSFTTPEQEFRI